jgi:hypothetical protein
MVRNDKGSINLEKPTPPTHPQPLAVAKLPRLISQPTSPARASFPPSPFPFPPGTPVAAARGAHLATVWPNPAPSGMLQGPLPPPPETGWPRFLCFGFANFLRRAGCESGRVTAYLEARFTPHSTARIRVVWTCRWRSTGCHGLAASD